MRRGNPRGSRWFSTPEADRGRPSIRLTLSPEALEKLVALAERDEVSRSALVERLVDAAHANRKS